MEKVFSHKQRKFFSKLIWLAVLTVPFFQIEIIPPKPISLKRTYIPMEKAAFEHEAENSETHSVNNNSKNSSIPNLALYDLSLGKLDEEIQEDLKSAYLSENSFLANQFDFVLYRILDTSAFLQDFLNSSVPLHFRYFYSAKNEGAWKILFTSLVAISQNREGETETSPPDLSETTTDFGSLLRSFAFFQVSRILQPERAILERKRSRYFALLFSYPPNFDLGTIFK
ncbi:hypothetical protein CH379_018100 [Leptospira ellisii]|uniref:Uncharacterized protein n=1 Tax=Leptospira ellisii TaxID=2023197 RepID=A0A2N0B4H8_9LEPT|nr:hypothetical protein [Leptospira ellisii]MDV6237549.1 hypothetical protein [Leptospira ellisii]PJZ91454.1 hypothetical protein CH379_18580 [Leptospira ellisii]PKA05044.1 hypothetical protein CH375_07395 [Leptospira ellisii]